jgi:hypothetical protein
VYLLDVDVAFVVKLELSLESVNVLSHVGHLLEDFILGIMGGMILSLDQLRILLVLRPPGAIIHDFLAEWSL